MSAPRTPRAVAPINAYLRLRAASSIVRPEFWTNDRIEYLRTLSETGRAVVRNLRDAEALVQGSRSIRDRLILVPSAGEGTAVGKPSIGVRLGVGRQQIPLALPLVWGDMSFGAIHAEAVKALVASAERTGILSGTGEGGLHPDIRRYRRFNVQWASARFGVTLDTLKSGSAIFIKIGQGAKPGIGGHLPGEKVVGQIPSTRRIPEGRDAISPAPHHDIYSIEDLGQRIWALKEATGQPVFVKVAATNYVPYVACGIARMGADGVVIDGQLAGTGATPEVIRDNVGLPIELAVAAADRMLREQMMDGEPLRSRVSVIAGGGIANSVDLVKCLALGADAVMMGTAALMAMGCVMVHRCHTGKCPTALATQTPHRLLDCEWATERLVHMVEAMKEEVSFLLGELGLNSCERLVGNREVLRGRDMNAETLSILGVQPAEVSRRPRHKGWPAVKDVLDGPWSPWRRDHIKALADAGEALITSMGSLASPFVEPPRFPCDWLRSDGAQVTRPSIDPYREEIETWVYLAQGRVRLSSPMILDLSAFPLLGARGFAFLARTAAATGLLSVTPVEAMSEETARFGRGVLLDLGASITASGHERASVVPAVALDDAARENLTAQVGAVRSTFRKPVCVRIASERGVEKRVRRAARAGADMIILYEVEPGVSRDSGVELTAEEVLPLEIAVSTADQALRAARNGSHPYRRSVSLVAQSDRVRGAEDVFKHLALGADAVGIGSLALLGAFGRTADEAMELEGPEWTSDQAAIRLENLLWALQKELRLMLGAAGASSATTLVSSRELLRAVDLDPDVRRLLDVKPAGR